MCNTHTDEFPLVSIITLNYKQAQVTMEFLESCRHLTYPNYEIHVCDMRSDATEELRTRAGSIRQPDVFFHYNEKNLGFAGGNNWGMQFARGAYFLFLNNDTEVAPDLIEKLLIPFEQQEDAGVVCPKINYFDVKDRIQYAGFTRMNPYTGRTWAVGNQELDHAQYDRIYTTHGAHGAAMMVKREVVDAVGGLPERFFLYYEEWDWSARIQKAGYRVYFQGNTVVYHKESMSVGKLNPMKEYYLTRNRILYMRRNADKLQLLAFTAFFSCFTFPKTIFKYIMSGNIPFLRAFIRGVKDNFGMSAKSLV